MTEEAVERGAIELTVKMLVLNQAKAAGLKRIVREIHILNGIAGRCGRADRILLAMTRGLQCSDPLRAEAAVIAKGIIAAAAVLTLEIGGGIAIEQMIDIEGIRAAHGIRVLEPCGDDRLARAEVVSELGGTEVLAQAAFQIGRASCRERGGSVG